MTNLQIRLGNIETDDYDIFAQLLNQADGSNVTGDVLRNWDRTNKTKDDQSFRYAACIDDEIVGYGLIYYPESAKIARITVWLTIDEQHRGQGFGSTFYEVLQAKARDLGAVEFSSMCKDDSTESLNFAQKRGFSIRRHMYESEINLETFDISKWQSKLDAVEAQGIRFSSLTDEGNTEEALYKLYELNTKTGQDDPSSDGTYQSTFENFKAKIVNAHWFYPEGQLLAIDGERFVGLGAIGFEDDGVTAYNAFTGVDRDYRGRGIAQALKVVGCQFAKEKGCKRIETTNDSDNAPMLSINKKMAYQRTTGEYLLRKTL